MTISICSRCKNERRIEAKGLCKSCYNYQYSNRPHNKAAREKWAKNNREYWRKYRKRK